MDQDTFLIVAGVATLWLLPAHLVARYAQRKAGSYVAFAVIGLLFTAPISWSLAYLLPERVRPARRPPRWRG